MAVHFCNNGELDLRAVTTMGVSVKEEGSIGYFGTGLKYAIATLLRTGHDVNLWIAGRAIPIEARAESIRGKEFQVVYVDGVSAGFTTELGKNWKVWQAYRELACNAMDEGAHYIGPFLAGVWGTVIRIGDGEIDDAHRDHGNIFCHKRPVIAELTAAIYRVEVRHGETKSVYYRGVRVLELDKPAMYTYNLLHDTALTEDRTMASPFSFYRILGEVVANCENEPIISKTVRARDDWAESGMDFGSVVSGDPVSEVFLDHIEQHWDDLRVSITARRLTRRRRPKVYKIDDAALSRVDLETVERAEELCRLISPGWRLDYKIVPRLGTDVLGAYIPEEGVYIAHDTVAQGPFKLAGTLIEEWLHKEKSYPDGSRSFQNWTLDALARMAGEVAYMQRMLSGVVRVPAPESDPAPAPVLPSRPEPSDPVPF